MLSLGQIKDAVMLNSGQFITDFEDTLMDTRQFTNIIKRELQVYNRYYPLIEKRVFNLYDGKIFNVKDDKVIPDAITEIRDGSTSSASFNLYGLYYSSSTTQYGIISNLNWKYYKPELYFQYSEGDYECKCLVFHRYDDVSKCIATMNPDFTGTDHYFLDMVTGKFMEYLGKSRTAFTLSSFPVSTNADTLISEGKSLYESTMETVKINSRFCLAVLV